MSDHKRLLEYVETSFLKSLLSDPEVTDISFNGRKIYYVHNSLGRRRFDVAVTAQDVSDFIRQIANLSDQHFSYAHPLLDVSIGKYRFNAVGFAIARLDYEATVNFSLRIGRSKEDGRIIKFQPDPVLDRLFRHLVSSGISMVIAGKTGVGKTEFQKYLISIMPEHARIIVIDNVLELEGIKTNKEIDMSIWQVNPSIKGGDFAALIANGLRSHPDWVIVAEARGVEMKEALMAAMTGHPIITTIHSLDVTTLPARMARMVMANQPTLRYAETLADIKDHFPILVQLRKRTSEDGHIIREIHQIGEMRSSTHKIKLIYEWNGQDALYHKLSRKLQRKLINDTSDIAEFV